MMLMTEQKPSSKKVSMKVRMTGLHTTDLMMRLEMRLQHSRRMHFLRRTAATTRRASRSQSVIKTPEFSSSLTDS